ncbi:lysylphosphatidylglycerol synthase domain-containing protein [Sediminibacter sp. Hel_I_10]|uniref:lysylphosphatidylglycerol synthase domain-containing protein n=1 Tax=Sediminibacter sp. Hel_I_10 TaxID=1392490 RepID=UPI00350F18F5
MVIGRLSYKTKQFFFVLIKIGIVVLAFYFIYKKLVYNSNLDLDSFHQILRANNLISIKNLSFLVILSACNWYLEIVKWRVLVKSIVDISIKKAAEQSLAALTASLFTPNRIGEYGAKAIYFKKQHRKPVVVLNFLGNMMQMSVTTLFGVIGLMLFQTSYKTNLLQIDPYLMVFLLVVAIVMMTLYLKRKSIKIKGFSLEKLRHFYQTLPKRSYVIGFSLSLCRYLIFSFQFYILLRLLNSPLGYLDAMTIISAMYLLTSVIPSLFLFDVVVKGSVALYLFSFAGLNSLIILSVVTLMWLFNFVLPALFGSYFVLNFSIPQNNN